MAKKAMLHEIRIEPLAEGSGVISHTTHRTARGGQGGGPSEDYDTDKVHHPSIEHLHEHLEKHLSEHFPKRGDKQQVEEEDDEEY